jgi:hypothetical protein
MHHLCHRPALALNALLMNGFDLFGQGFWWVATNMSMSKMAARSARMNE